MGLIQSDSNNAFQQLAQRLTAARAAALDQLTATRMGLIDNLSRLNGKVVPTQYQTSSQIISVAVNAGSSWSDWYQVIPTTSFPAIVCVLLTTDRLSFAVAEIQIGEGAVNNEVVRAHVTAAEDGWWATRFRISIASGSRVSIRYRGVRGGVQSGRLIQLLLGG